MLLYSAATGILRCTWVSGSTRIFRCTWIGCAWVFRRTRVSSSHLFLNLDSLLLPRLHGLINLWSERSHVGVEIHVFLRVGIHWLTAKENGVSEVVHDANGRQEPRGSPTRIMQSGSPKSRDLNIHPVPGRIHGRTTDGPSSGVTTSTSKLIVALLTPSDGSINVVIGL